MKPLLGGRRERRSALIPRGQNSFLQLLEDADTRARTTAVVWFTFNCSAEQPKLANEAISRAQPSIKTALKSQVNSFV
jgi:hypothetical protein